MFALHTAVLGKQAHQSHKALVGKYAAVLHNVFRWAQHGTAQRSTAQQGTAQQSIARHSTAQHSTAQHSTAQHSTAPAS